MATRIQKFLALTTPEKMLLFQSWLLLGFARAGILIFSFKRLTAPLEHHRDTINPPRVTPAQLHRAVRIGYLVSVAAHHTPWQSRCLVQVLVTQRLLAKHGIPGQFYLGVRRGCDLVDTPGALSAHAWLQCGDEVVNGKVDCNFFTVVATFRWKTGETGRLQPC